MLALLLVVALSLTPLPQASGAPAQDPLATRGAQGMGFDQDKTTHHFRLYEDGGAIEVTVKEAADETNLAAIRSHLPHIAMLFGQGQFDLPHFIHATDVPGTADMTRLREKIRYRYVEAPQGGRVDIVTTDPDALRAVHAFLAFQISDHKTGDATTVGRRPGGPPAP
ncbi:MAG: hypothetical protein R2752_22350 [Vicinamibacterales bacterium]